MIPMTLIERLAFHLCEGCDQTDPSTRLRRAHPRGLHERETVPAAWCDECARLVNGGTHDYYDHAVVAERLTWRRLNDVQLCSGWFLRNHPTYGNVVVCLSDADGHEVAVHRETIVEGELVLGGIADATGVPA